MRKIGANIELLVGELAGDSDRARVNMRARQVRDRYRRVLEAVYRETAPLFLAHTNNVYILKKDDVPTLIVYVDDSLFAAELNAQRELIRLKLLELFGEAVERFDIHVSRGNYKNHHPYLDSGEPAAQASPLPPLNDDEKKAVDETAAMVQDPQLREALVKAMSADLARKKSE